MVELKLGQEIGGFIVKGQLGKGGMGEVFLVNDPRLAIDRALKVIALKRPRNSAGGDGRSLDTKQTREFRQRFLREARTLARLRHSHIIPVHYVSEHEGNPFLVMTHFPSKDARVWLHEDQPQLDEVKLVADQLAGALAYAHSQGVLHRDIKLSNILVQTEEQLQREVEERERRQSADPDVADQQGDAEIDVRAVFADVASGKQAPLHLEAMLIDFGLAKSSSDPDLTHTGRNMGTYSYMAPEYVAACVSGAKAKHTELTDLWAFGCALYGLTCQRLPFQGHDDLTLLRRIQDGDFPSVASLRSDASAEWSALLSDLMQVDPTKRVQSAHELVARLAAITSPLDPAKAPFIPVFDPCDEEPAANDAPPEANARPVSIFVTSAPHPKVTPREPGLPPAIDLPPLDDVEGISPSRSSPHASAERSPVVLSHPARSAHPALAAAMRGQGAAAVEVSPAGARVAGADLPDDDASVASQSSASTGSTSDSRASVAVPFRPPAPKTPSAKTFALRRLALPVVAALVVILVGGGLVLMTGSAHAGSNAPATQYVDPDELARRGRSDEELKQLAQAKDARALPIVFAPFAAPVPTATLEGLAATASPAAHHGERSAAPAAPSPATSPRSRPRSASSQREPAPSAADAFTARYGSRVDFNASSGPPRAAPSAVNAEAAARAGIKVPVRVTDAIVSSPTGPVIAVVTQLTRVGSLTLPAGAQLHGQTAGTSGSRVLVNFSFAIVDGKNVAVRGSALGLDGRAGVPGTKSLGGPSDVAAGGAVGGAQGAVDAVSSAVGDSILGSALRGAGNPGAQKLGRINNEEEVVSSPRGARFFVYAE